MNVGRDKTLEPVHLDYECTAISFQIMLGLKGLFRTTQKDEQQVTDRRWRSTCKVTRVEETLLLNVQNILFIA